MSRLVAPARPCGTADGPRARIIAIVGAARSGRTTLAVALHARLAAAGRRVALVADALGEFRAREGRAPRATELSAIGDEQTRCIAAAAHGQELVVADTTALWAAVCAEAWFGDRSLYAPATAAQRHCDLTLLTALDLDGRAGDGTHAPADTVDALLRAALARARLSFSVVAGHGEARLDAAWRALQRLEGRVSPAGSDVDDDRAGAPLGRWHCERCGDPDCEHRVLLSPLLARGA